MEMSNGNSGHSHAEGLRVHHLANLGGLIAIAGLDLEPPDFLLGALLSLAQEAAKLSREQRERLPRWAGANSTSGRRESVCGSRGTALVTCRRSR